MGETQKRVKTDTKTQTLRDLVKIGGYEDMENMKPKAKPVDPMVKALYDAFLSTCEVDQNWDQAGVTDGLFAIARAIRYHADAVRTNPIKVDE